MNRLKLLKRQGYGRAAFDLLRLRVLHHAKPISAISSTPLVNTHQRRLVCESRLRKTPQESSTARLTMTYA
jgi:hypothetical protein